MGIPIVIRRRSSRYPITGIKSGIKSIGLRRYAITKIIRIFTRRET